MELYVAHAPRSTEGPMRRSNILLPSSRLATLLAGLMAASCGGGGGTSSNGNNPPPGPQYANVDTPPRVIRWGPDGFDAVTRSNQVVLVHEPLVVP
jgi:hypothetical protein